MTMIHSCSLVLEIGLLYACLGLTYAGRYVQIATSGTGTLNKANDYGIPISGKHSLALDVMGCKNAYLFLSNTSTIGKSSGNYYEVALSIGANGTVSLINDGCFSCKSKALVVKRVLNCTAFKTFRVTWFRKGSLEVREGSNTSSRLLLSSSRLSEIELNYLHLVSPGQKVVWRIYVECPDGRYGADCDSLCGQCMRGVVCHEHTGTCPMCQPGWSGERCDRLCANGTYGQNCKQCGECLGGVCHILTGKCARGCIRGWSGELCQEACPRNTFGVNCTSPCGHCACLTSCNPTSGGCPQGCQSGWRGDRCDQECSPGFYGSGCKQCGHCRPDAVCDKVSGSCARGCAAGWTGERCDKPCPPGTYGVGCLPCGHCRDGTRCDATSGNCPVECEVGWTGSRCDKACAVGKYGDQCKSTCGHCSSGTTCDPVTGKCPADCSPGWRTDRCDQGCPSGTFGTKCLPCGHCKDRGQCDKTTGDCGGECHPSWTGSRCDRHCSSGTYGSACKPCGQCKNDVVCDRVSGQCPSGCEVGWSGTRCDQATSCPRPSVTSASTPRPTTATVWSVRPPSSYVGTTSTVKMLTEDKECICPTAGSSTSVQLMTGSPNNTRGIMTKKKDRRADNLSLQPGYISTIVVVTILVPLSVFTTIMWCRSRPKGKPVYYNNSSNSSPFGTSTDTDDANVLQIHSEL